MLKTMQTEKTSHLIFKWLWNNENKITAKTYFEECEKLEAECKANGKCTCGLNNISKGHFERCLKFDSKAVTRTAERLDYLYPSEKERERTRLKRERKKRAVDFNYYIGYK